MIRSGLPITKNFPWGMLPRHKLQVQVQLGRSGGDTYKVNGKTVSEAEAKASMSSADWAAIKGGQKFAPGESYSVSTPGGIPIMPEASGSTIAAPAVTAPSAVPAGSGNANAVTQILKRLDVLVAVLTKESGFLEQVLS
jgi:hypothetical protein